MANIMNKVSALTSSALTEYLINRRDGRLVEFLETDPTVFTDAPEQIWVNTTDTVLKYTFDGGVTIEELIRQSEYPYYNADMYGLVGDGTTDNYEALNTLISTTINGEESTILFPPGTYKISTSITIPSNVSLLITKGAMLQPETGITITINGPVEAGLWQIFTGLGTIASNMKIDSIHPEWYPGTDAEKISTAITAAIAQDKSIKFSRMYDITGSTITINKSSSDRTILYLLGEGGGIRKDDAGSVFTAVSTDMGDIVSTNMMYKSITGGQTVIWDCDKLIRIVSSKDSYVNVDTMVRANTRFAQSVRFSHCTITGGTAWAFEWAKSFDVTINDCTIEHRNHFLRNTVFTGNPDNVNLRIVNNVIEGLSGKTADLGASYGVIIQGNYTELNTGGYFDLSLSSNFHNGLTIIGNTCQQSAAQEAAEVPFFKIANTGTDGVLSAANVSSGVLYSGTFAGNNGKIVSASDVSFNNKKIIGSTSLLSEIGKVTTITDGKSYGRVAQYRFPMTSTSFTSGEIKDVTITTTLTLVNTDSITVGQLIGSGSQSIALHHWRRSGNNIVVRIENLSVSTQNITCEAVVLQIV